MIEINHDPSKRDIRIFGLLWLLFFAAVGGVALWKPQGLVGASMILGSAWLISLLFNSQNRLQQLAGIALPGLFALVGTEVQRGVAAMNVASVLWGAGAVGALLIWVAPGLGRRFYVGWMLAAVPIGWTLSHLVLGAVYYVVLTPIGWIMRLFGHDPMLRRFEPGAPSYWIERPKRPDPSRYFRQF